MFGDLIIFEGNELLLMPVICIVCFICIKKNLTAEANYVNVHKSINNYKNITLIIIIRLFCQICQTQRIEKQIIHKTFYNSTYCITIPHFFPQSSSKNTWTDSAPPPTAVTSELWGAPMNKARQGPPPGLSSKGVSGNTSNGWAGLGGVSRSSSSWGLQSGGGGAGGGGGGGNAGWLVGGTWLLLKNLTPQIDGSTLKTLCMQHGPVQDFRLYLNHGIALTKYSSRDESSKVSIIASIPIYQCSYASIPIYQ